MNNQPIPGYRIGQAANLAHDYLLEKGLPPNPDRKNSDAPLEMPFKQAWMERTWMYINVLNEMEARFGKDNPEPYSAEMQKRKGMEHGGESGIPVITLDEDQPMNINQ